MLFRFVTETRTCIYILHNFGAHSIFIYTLYSHTILIRNFFFLSIPLFRLTYTYTHRTVYCLNVEMIQFLQTCASFYSFWEYLPDDEKKVPRNGNPGKAIRSEGKKNNQTVKQIYPARMCVCACLTWQIVQLDRISAEQIRAQYTCGKKNTHQRLMRIRWWADESFFGSMHVWMRIDTRISGNIKKCWF